MPRKQFDPPSLRPLAIAALVSPELLLEEDLRDFQCVTAWLHRDR
jgi:hypothetical protein